MKIINQYKSHMFSSLNKLNHPSSPWILPFQSLHFQQLPALPGHRVIARPSRDLGPRGRPKELSPIEAAREAAAKKGRHGKIRHGGSAVPARRNSGTMAAHGGFWRLGGGDIWVVFGFM